MVRALDYFVNIWLYLCSIHFIGIGFFSFFKLFCTNDSVLWFVFLFWIFSQCCLKECRFYSFLGTQELNCETKMIIKYRKVHNAKVASVQGFLNANFGNFSFSTDFLGGLWYRGFGSKISVLVSSLRCFKTQKFSSILKCFSVCMMFLFTVCAWHYTQNFTDWFGHKISSMAEMECIRGM